MKPALFTAAILFLIELLSGAWVQHYGNSLDHTRSIVVPHSKLGWKHDTNLDRKFLGEKFSTDGSGFRKTVSSQGKRILFLGPSSTVGWGVSDEKSYPSVVGKTFDVTNASQIGYSTHQGLALLRNELSGKKFDVTVISYGINDVDFHRFYWQSQLTDADEFKAPHGEFQTTLQKWVFKSSAIVVLQKAVFTALAKITGAGSARPDEKQIRVTGSEFRKNLIDLIHEVRKSGSRPLLLLTSTHFKKNSDARIDLIQNVIMKRMTGYEDIIREVAGAENVLLADPDEWLKGPRDGLFVDPVHFSETGNEQIGNGLTAMITGISG